ncbi:MAG: Lrp/AsnC family transcriptional regulator, partial [Candidatus Heimdallarchaeota archaeon]|nr:Lrp/AsnC family transcriptional regulator [Candidatus Heimdallarchaeota archaeon]
TNQNLVIRLEEADRILEDDYAQFHSVIVDNGIQYESPLWDIACFLTYYELSPKSVKKQKWVEYWFKFSRTRRYKNLIYMVPASYVALSDLRKAKNFFVNLLEQSKRSVKELTWDTFLSIFYQFRASVKPSFNKREFAVFKTILDRQTMVSSELKTYLDIDLSNISKYKNIVESKRVLHQGISLNYHKLDLSVYGLMFEYPLTNDINLFSELSKSAFFHSLYTGNVGCRSVFSYFVTPRFKEVERDFKKLSKTICENNHIPSSRVLRFLTETRLKSFNCNIYDFKNGQWKLEPQNLQFTLQDYDSRLIESVPIITRDFEKCGHEKLRLNKTGLDVLNHILANKHLSIREIVRDLKLTEKEVKKQVEKLQKNELYKLRYNPLFVFGLKHIIFFLSDFHENQHEIHKTLSFLPEVFSEQYVSKGKNGLYLVLRVPYELVVDAIESLTSFFKGKIENLFIVDQMITTRYQLPMDRYETVFQEWKYLSEDILGVDVK